MACLHTFTPQRTLSRSRGEPSATGRLGSLRSIRGSGQILPVSFPLCAQNDPISYELYEEHPTTRTDFGTELQASEHRAVLTLTTTISVRVVDMGMGVHRHHMGDRLCQKGHCTMRTNRHMTLYAKTITHIPPAMPLTLASRASNGMRLARERFPLRPMLPPNVCSDVQMNGVFQMPTPHTHIRNDKCIHGSCLRYREHHMSLTELCWVDDVGDIPPHWRHMPSPSLAMSMIINLPSGAALIKPRNCDHATGVGVRHPAT